ncbi:alpha/beta fold hydrolase [Natronolimnohabitans innermongolicus]|uniref:alpha/beta fold hydrolase n=1 Tax=Natronolimnohabitans innermongolicus TaxID=253107 RepID=UPI0009FEB23B|nr:alpha/beta hydrolase [Natronolimnohabitans innermongolicus]
MADSTQPETDEGGTVHRAVSDDGTEIAGRVHGTGPPVVLVHGAMADGEFIWESLVPHLADRFTCYAMSVRSRGLSEHSTDLSPERRLEDVTAFVESIGEPVGLLGWSQGGRLALGAAAQTDAVSAVAAYEPAVFEVLEEDEYARFVERIGRVSELAAEDRPVDAARTFLEWVATEDELNDAQTAGIVENCAANVPVFLQEVQGLDDYDGPSPTGPSALAEIEAPVLLLHGSSSIPDPWFVDGVHHVAEHATDSRVREIEETGHFGPVHRSDAVAEELARFFAATPDPLRS